MSGSLLVLLCSTIFRADELQEGELRPQLLDRFGLSVQVATMQDTKIRTQMVLDRLAYDAVCLWLLCAPVGSLQWISHAAHLPCCAALNL